MNRVRNLPCYVTLLGTMAVALPAHAVEVTVTIENKSPKMGLYLTPFWVGFHDGTFDLFNPGSAVPPGGGIERIAEDGVTSTIATEFANSSAGMNGGVDGTIIAPSGFPGAPVFDPKDKASATFNLDPAANQYFSFASMVIPSNDAFIGNNNPMRFEIFDSEGKFVGPITIKIAGSMVWDAGTEANTEMDAAFFNQTAGNTGVTTADPVVPHPGFIDSFENPGGDAMILGGTSLMPPGIFFHKKKADFTRPNYKLARITIKLADDSDEHDEDDDE